MAETLSAELLEFPNKDNRRLLHAVYRVGDLDRSIKFYTEAFGMKLLRKRDVPEEKYSNAFLGFGPEDSNFAVELTYNYGVDKYDIGTGFGHFAIATADVYKLAQDIKAKGGTITREAGPVKGGTSVIAFAKDPDGYLFELIERPNTPEPLCQVMLRVGDLDRSIKFYEKVAVSTSDVYKSAQVVNHVIQELGGKITRQAGPLPGLGTKIVSFLDPDGWKTFELKSSMCRVSLGVNLDVLVDHEDFLKELHNQE
ncbi:hypothetical protein M8C21_004041 [Ambrosia artemisiifolia]|uniref:lactoylglutathione lyase n=1 Tax=Ambrosia artemisiifolia TaxID=4212 RepID=A0AAD5DC26_AMBAR|nr:hypothetical protein M8C21_004041 [Ambrosia artemisiifolia]